MKHQADLGSKRSAVAPFGDRLGMSVMVGLGVMLATVLLAASPAAGQAPARQAAGPLRVHPTNPRYFTDGTTDSRGTFKAVYLTGSHTWATLQDLGTTNPPPAFDFNEYLDFLEQHHHNFIRLWRWELTEWTGWKEGKTPLRYGTQHPWKRTGPGMALDGRPKFDLEQWDESHFERLRARVQAAGDRGIYVSIMLFEGCMLRDKPSTWAGNPLNAANNESGINGDPDGDGFGLEVQMLQVPTITELQKAYIRRVVDAVNDLDNVLYEISNESLYRPEILNWQHEMIRYINEYQASKPQRHPVGMTNLVGFNAKEKSDSHAALYAGTAAWVSPGMPIYGPKDPYSIDPPAATGQKVEMLDTDHTWNNACMVKKGPYQLDRADRVWVWKSFLRGYNPIYMDPLDLSRPNGMMAYVEYCTPAVLSARKAMGQTRDLADKIDLAAMTPQESLASSGYCLANPGQEYLVYQPDSQAAFTVTLAAGEYDLQWFNPSLGETAESGSLIVEAGDRSFTAPFGGDAVLHISNSAQRERPYFYFDAESQKSGDPLPQPPFFPQPWKEAGTEHPKRGRVVADPTAPQGKHVFMWDVAEPKTTELLQEVKFARIPEAGTNDYYYAFFVRFDRKNGIDIWHDGDGDSFDKGFEIIGDGIRWVIHFGNHAVRMKDHHFSCYVSNSTYHLNRNSEVYDAYYPNHGGFSQYKSPQLEYEKWHAFVFKMKWATDDTGEIGLWVNGRKALEYKGIKTAKVPGAIERLQFFGTIAQPAYDAPPHIRKIDALIFTDDLQDIVDRGYLQEVADKSM